MQGSTDLNPRPHISFKLKDLQRMSGNPFFFGNFMLTGRGKGSIVVYTTLGCNEEKLQSHGDPDDEKFKNYRDRCPRNG